MNESKELDPNRAKEFVSLSWHDSKLLDFRLVRSHDHDDLACSVDFLSGHDRWKSATVTFIDCTLVMVDIDLDGKRVCADSIFNATCDLESSYKAQLEISRLRGEKHPLQFYYHFRIFLIHPGGELNVLAKDFDVNWHR